MEQAAASIEESSQVVEVAELKFVELAQIDEAKDMQKANEFMEDEEVNRAEDHAHFGELGMRAGEDESETRGLKRPCTPAVTGEAADEPSLSPVPKRPRAGPEDSGEASGGVCQEQASEVVGEDL